MPTETRFIHFLPLSNTVAFGASISQAMPKKMERLTDFVFVSLANLTLDRRDLYLSHLKTGI